MSNKITDKPTTTSTPTNIFVNLAGTIRQLTWSGFLALVNAAYVPVARTINGHALSADVTVSKTDVGLSAVTNDTQLKAADLDTDSGMAANSDSKVPSQKAVKTALAGKAASSHSHSASDITSGTLDPARIPILYSGVQVVSAGGIADLSSPQQTSVTQGAVVTTTDGRRWVYKGSGSKTSEASYIEMGDMTPAWSAIADKPSTFAPPAPTTTVIGGVKRNEGSSGQYVRGIDTDGSLLFDTPGGGTMNFYNEAWVSNVFGSDDTGLLHRPDKMFGTTQAAYDAGARIIHILHGAQGPLAIDNAENVSLVGYGYEKCSISYITGKAGFTSGTIRGNGADNLSVGYISFQGADGVDTGSSGASMGTINVSGLRTSYINVKAGAGGAGSKGTDGMGGGPPGTGSAGGPGGNAGTVNVDDCILSGNVTNLGGDGGTGGAGGDSIDYSTNGGDGARGGDGGSPGTVYLTRTTAGGANLAGSAAGTGGSGGGGAATGGTGDNGNAGSAGAINARFCDLVTGATAGESANFRFSAVADFWNA